MSDEPTPSGVDFFDQIDAKADEIAGQILQRLDDASKGGGKRTVSVKCSHCGHSTSTTVQVLDAKDDRDTLALLTSAKRAASDIRAKRAGDDTSKQSRAVLGAIEEMSSEEIAEEYARLQKELQGAA